MRIIDTEDDLAEGVAHLVAVEPRFARAVKAAGMPPLRRRPQGFAPLLRIIVGQQVPVGTDETHPLVLTTGRVLAQFLSGNQTMRIPEQNRKAPRPVLEVHSTTAETFGLVDGQLARLVSRQATSDFEWQINDGLRPDTVFLPYHWVECNNLIADDLDPISGIPGFKFTPVAMSPVSQPPDRAVPQASGSVLPLAVR